MAGRTLAAGGAVGCDVGMGVTEPRHRPTSHADAVRSLDDSRFVAYALVQGFKLVISLICKRWPELG